MHQIHTGSTEYLRVAIATTVNGAVVNPTSDTVAFSIVADGSAVGAFTTGSWETDVVSGVTTYYARILIAAGTYAAGDYRVFVKVTDSPEVPVVEAGKIRVYA